MEPGAVWAGPGYFILSTSSLKGVALNWRKREHERALICSVFPGEQSSQQSSVWAVQLEDLYIVVFVSGLTESQNEQGWKRPFEIIMSNL